MPETEPSIDDVRAAAQRAGLSLTDEELYKLRRSAGRMKTWGEAIRASIAPEDEPATTFSAGRPRS